MAFSFPRSGRQILNSLFLSSVGLLLGACAEDPTEVVVQVHTDVPCDVQAAITAGPVGEVGNRVTAAQSTVCDPATGSLGQVVIVPKASKDTPVAIEVRVRADKGSPDNCLESNGYDGCIVARRIFSYIEGRSVEMRVDLKNPCLNTPCSSTTTCVAQGLGKKSCVDAHVDLKTCENGCDDALLLTQSPCAPEAIQCGEQASRCDVVNGAAQCVCEPGFANPAGAPQSCVDIDECAAKTHGCDANADCTNSEGSVACTCKPGYTGDGKTCKIIEAADCATTCDPNATCQKQNDTFACVCNAGYAANGSACVDIDECATAAHDCDALSASCENTVGSFECNCSPNQILCSAGCVDPKVDPLFCGATSGCGVDGGSAGDVCTAAQTCSAGKCKCPSAFPFTYTQRIQERTPVVLAKINADERADLLSPKLVQFAQADGSFVQDPSLDSGYGTFAVGHINDDAILDSVTMRGFPFAISANILGASGVTSVKETPLEGMQGLVAIAIGDIDGNEHGDLALVRETGNIAVFWGDGTGAFTAAKEFAIGGVTALGFGDFDGDGLLDLAAAVRDAAKLSVLFGSGDSNVFKAAKDFSVGAGPSSLAVADLDADGRSDLVVTSRATNIVEVLYGAQDQTLTGKLELTVGTAPAAVALGDVNGDGSIDLAVANADSFGEDDGGDASILLAKSGEPRAFQAEKRINVGVQPLSLALGDVNGDGTLDLAVTNLKTYARSAPFSVVHILLGLGDGTFTEMLTDLSGFGAFGGVHDFNGDGELDFLHVINGGASGTTVLSLGKGNGTFHVASPVGEYGAYGRGGVFADLDSDGDPDVVSPYMGNVEVRLNELKENDRFVRVGSEADSPAPTASGGVLGLAELTGDGKPDLVSIEAPTIRVHVGRGDGRFDAGPTLAGEATIDDVVLAQLNADNRSDIITIGSGKVQLFLSDGATGTNFKPAVTLETGTGPVDVRAVDVNNDSVLDLVVRAQNHVEVLLGKGNGEFNPRSTLPTNGTPSSLVVADLDVDGRADVLFTTDSSSQFAVMYGNGNGTFKAAVLFPMVSTGGVLAAADFSGDGRPDVLTRVMQVIPGGKQCP